MTAKESGGQRAQAAASYEEDPSELSVFVRVGGRLAQFKRPPTREYWEGHWQAVPESVLRYALRESSQLGSHAAFFRRQLGAGSRVLEAGCGVGLWVRRLHQNGYRVLGLDYARQTLIRSRGLAPDLVFAAGDLRRLPLESGSFDAHLSFGVLEHYPEGPGEILAEARRILRPGGRVVASVPQVNRFRRALATCSPAEAEARGYRFHQFYFEPAEILQVLEDAGFEPLPDVHCYSVRHGLIDGSERYRRVERRVPGLARAGMLLDFVPGLPERCGHMVFVAGRKP